MTKKRLYDLLPDIYRRLDQRRGHPLYALVTVLESVYDTLEENITGLYNDWFIETCAPWCIPYIGDQLGIDGLDEGKQFPGGWRALVANTLGYRRRKGTIAPIANAVGDAAGWGTTAVEFFRLISITQNVHHLCLNQGKTVNLRNARDLENIDSPFDTTSHTVDLSAYSPRYLDESGSPGDAHGKYNIPNIGIFIWRLQSYPREEAAASRTDSGYYTFNPFGLDTPLFNCPLTRSDHNVPAREQNLPVPLGPELLRAQLEKTVKNPGYRPIIRIFTRKKPGEAYEEIEPQNIRVCSLEDGKPSTLVQKDKSALAAVDPARGRLVFTGTEQIAGVRVSYSYGFSADMGGGAYRRSLPLPAPVSWQARVSGSFTPKKNSSFRDNRCFSSLGSAIKAWQSSLTEPGKSFRGKPRTPQYMEQTTGGFDAEDLLHDSTFTSTLHLPPWEEGGFIQVLDNDTYSLNQNEAPGQQSSSLKLLLEDHCQLVITAAQGKTPCISGGLHLSGSNVRVILNGLWIRGTIKLSGQIDLVLQHCTLRSGLDSQPGLRLPVSIHAGQDNSQRLRVEISHCITGPICLPGHTAQIKVQDSIIDGFAGYALTGSGNDNDNALDYGPTAEIERSTILGKASLTRLTNATDALFTGVLTVQDTNTGSVSFSYLPRHSRAPVRHRCVPPFPPGTEKSFFNSTVYGRPGYLQLSSTCPREIKTGAKNGAEIGAFNFLCQSRREAGLQQALKEYLPYGRNPGVFYVT
jgi:hypothetical protein